MKITLSNGTEFEALGVHGRSMNYQGTQRDSLVFLFDPEAHSLTDIVNAFNEENCSAITLEDGNGNTYLHENYTIRIEAGIGYKEMVKSGSVSTNDTTQAVYVRMAQTTLAERKLLSQQEVLDVLVAQALEG